MGCDKRHKPITSQDLGFSDQYHHKLKLKPSLIGRICDGIQDSITYIKHKTIQSETVSCSAIFRLPNLRVTTAFFEQAVKCISQREMKGVSETKWAMGVKS